MGEHTGITWTDHTFNTHIGCARVSPACDHCYAETGSRRLAAQHGLKLWEGDRYFTSDAYWKQPLKWDRAAARDGVRRRVFCASFGDVFEDRRDLDPVRVRLAALIARTTHLDWQLLTKRADCVERLAEPMWKTWPPNVWLGATTEDQSHYHTRWPHIARIPAAVRFVSHEPALGPLIITAAPYLGNGHTSLVFPSWVITGGESGRHARPYRLEWARNLVRATRDTPVRLFVKQLGARIHGDHSGFRVNRWILEGGHEWVPPIIGERALVPGHAIGFVLYDPKGGDASEWPPSLRVREFPS